MSGALVAGLDAGLIYNEFPYMGLGLTPPKSELFDPFYAHTKDQSDLWWRNMLENPSLVQLDHRVLAVSTFTLILSFYLYARGRKMKAVLPKDVRRGVASMMHHAWFQVALGISTLIYMVPTWLAAAHQATALALFTSALVLGSRLHVPKRTVTLVRRAVKAQSTVVAPGGLRKGVGKAAGTVEQKIS